MSDFKHKFIFDKDLDYSIHGTTMGLISELSDILGKDKYDLEWTWVTNQFGMPMSRCLLCVKLKNTKQLTIMKLRYGNLERKE